MMLNKNNKAITWIQPYYDIILNLIPIDTKTVLDIGAGNGIFGFILKKTRNVELTALEPFNYDLNHYDIVIKEKYPEYTLTQRYDCIIALEMIEHLNKYDAMNFLKLCRIASNKAIISTPYIYQEQDEYDNNPLQKHLCNITIQDFRDKGYKVYLYGCINLKIIQIRFLAHRHLKFLLNRFITNIIGVYEK